MNLSRLTQPTQDSSFRLDSSGFAHQIQHLLSWPRSSKNMLFFIWFHVLMRDKLDGLRDARCAKCEPLVSRRRPNIVGFYATSVAGVFLPHASKFGAAFF